MTIDALPDARHDTIYPEQRLWCAVIQQALRDAFMSDPDPAGPPMGMVRSYGLPRYVVARLRDEAIVWLLMDTEGFCRTCDLAGLDWRAVRARARRIIERGDATSIPTSLAEDTAAPADDADVRAVLGDGDLRDRRVSAAIAGNAAATVVLPGALGTHTGGAGASGGADEGSDRRD